MKPLKPLLLACSLISTLAFAQAPAQTAGQASSPSQVDQPDQSQKQHFPRDMSSKRPDTCVGPVSFCTLFFGS
ncbi:hypothetical protein [Paraburkholderia sp. PGU16]|jgi:hypothetical protein|uniref:hypothetical protein n=1 Tax=Paraburkholderia TaxID=1822464 RepID=UPI0015D98731|nr:hypothetical protein [Paraburkholderia sp. PGU16]BEU24672.1 hypothetical protein PBP221_48120 [Paraburkholderia sp. 22B1P]GJH32841.1 hypothetical protein CBA19CS91_08810 [Paraburkholderia hospita]